MSFETSISPALQYYLAARDLALRNTNRCLAAGIGQRLLDEMPFNWAIDWLNRLAFDHRDAVVVVGEAGAESLSYADLVLYSNQAANYFQQVGIEPGERVVMCVSNSLDLFAASLGLMKLGAVQIPLFASLTANELSERIAAAGARHLIADAAVIPKLPTSRLGGVAIAIGDAPPGWANFADLRQCEVAFFQRTPTRAGDPLMGYFTSGTTSTPKLAIHSHQSYPIGHLSSLFWHGIAPGDVHANVSAPGWAKHSWSSLFTPFAAQATALVFATDRSDPKDTLDALQTHAVTSFCAPPSYWRSLVRTGLGQRPTALRDALSAGESLDQAVVEAVAAAWGLQLRNGYGQTETTALVGCLRGESYPAGALGRPLPGYDIVLIDPATTLPGEEGEICVDLASCPVGVMLGYDSHRGGQRSVSDRYYRTGDLARRDPSGVLTLIGRRDDVFKSYDVRISPLELEQVLLRHPWVSEVAVFRTTDTKGEAVPAAAVVTSPGVDSRLARDALIGWQDGNLAEEYQMAEFWMCDVLPRTTSGKVSRSAVRRAYEVTRDRDPTRALSACQYGKSA